MTQRIFLTATMLWGLCATSGVLAQDKWGDLKGQFVFGPAGTKLPVAAPIIPTKDTQVCGVAEKLFEESVVINPENRGLEGIAVWLYVKRGEKTPPLHPDYEKANGDTIKIENIHCRFAPHVLTLRTTQTLEIGNADPIGHNTQITMLANASINPIIPAQGKITQQFKLPERFPAPVKCSIHPWMTGYLLVQDHPFMAVSDKDGNFEIKHLPPGEWTFQLWHEKSGFLKGGTVGGKQETWRRGQMTVKVEAGKPTDLGTIVLDPKTL